ncbi:phage antirepressor Ant [Virgibacillus pantothenticus]|uniref:BRO-N domain-containing protein n=1 Tax=Virgibacillus pantothenticus TaxID=1473 RepID=UPI001C2426FA|nr:BRO family protein [Virgibacillus pantothenticus]MBU8567603.1 phage antirepressor Ant [Virgibacillus pantothenticus]MBU8601391.1 phage antirepressor Ant [Virgibacillus pantothenticus]MBU8636208.1 phage antirepressor Ant [Virgibacillus pantothenticus]MBU8643728.1 phage antirepressor Ant [Virgibacillus pantothenticus]MBU8648016.1 phage antirepressor Ant [Virgibacillus pantothenticus]
MNELQTFENELFKVSAKQEGEQIMFDVEEVAKSLGITDKKNGTEYVRWSRVNSYLPENSPLVAKGDLIPEPLVYKLAFKASNEIAEKFQDWLAIEVIPQIRKTGSYGLDTSQLSPELQMVNGLFQSLAKQELETKKLAGEVQGIRDVVALNTVDWREDSRKLISKIAQSRGGGGAYREVNQEIYEEVERRGRFNLKRRLTNKRRVLAENGVSPSKRDKLTKVDVIADDKRLIEIYIAVVKEFAIKHGVKVD